MQFNSVQCNSIQFFYKNSIDKLKNKIMLFASFYYRLVASTNYNNNNNADNINSNIKMMQPKLTAIVL